MAEQTEQTEQTEQEGQDRIIKVNLISDRVIADPNPMGAKPGETVTWQLVEDAAGKDLELVFREVELTDEVGKSAPCGPKGPFLELVRSADRIAGTLPATSDPAGRFIYDLILDGVKLDWINGLSRHQNFGGLDVPPPPPRG